MITEEYVSFETAKLLKEKGFNEYCPLWYDLNRSSEGPFFYKHIGWYGHNSYDYNGKEIISAPTQQMAMRWLREECNIIINVWYSNPNWAAQYLEVRTQTGRPEFALIVENYKTYEETCESAIKYCLENLI